MPNKITKQYKKKQKTLINLNRLVGVLFSLDIAVAIAMLQAIFGIFMSYLFLIFRNLLKPLLEIMPIINIAIIVVICGIIVITYSKFYKTLVKREEYDTIIMISAIMIMFKAFTILYIKTIIAISPSMRIIDIYIPLSIMYITAQIIRIGYTKDVNNAKIEYYKQQEKLNRGNNNEQNKEEYNTNYTAHSKINNDK